MSKYLLTGGNGTLGTELQKHLSCFAPGREDLDIVKFTTDSDDPYDPIWLFDEKFHKKLGDVTTLIHAAAWTDVPGAETNKTAAVEANIIGTYNMAKYAHRMGWKFVYISTDYVYAGHIGNYSETSKTEPFNFYGFTKLAGEAFVNLENDLIIRTSFKPNDLWETKYNKAFIDIYTSADYVDVIVPEICLAISHDLRGVYNIATEKKSIYELATRRYPEVGELSRWEVSEWIKMPSDISINVDKFNEFKMSLEDNDE